MKKIKTFLPAFALACATTTYAQGLTLSQSVDYAVKNNPQVKAGEFNVHYFRQLQKSHADWGRASVIWMHGNYNSVNTDNNFTATQAIPFPTTMTSQIKLGKEQTTAASLDLTVTKNELVYQVKSAYAQLMYLKSFQQLLSSQDSLYRAFAKASEVRFRTGEGTLLEKTTAETQLLEIQNAVRQNESDINIFRTLLQSLLNAQDLPDAAERLHVLSSGDTSTLEKNPMLLRARQEVRINQQLKKVERNKFLPDITIGYFTQTLVGWQRVGDDELFFDRNKKFNGYQVGISIPLWFLPQVGRARAAHFSMAAAEQKLQHESIMLRSQLQQAQQEYAKNNLTVIYYESNALKNATLILQQSQKAYHGGEIGYVEYLQAMRQVQSIQQGYLLAINQLNQSIIRIQFLTGED